MMRKKGFRTLFPLAIICLVFVSIKHDLAQQVKPEEQNQEIQKEESPEKIIPSPGNIKESTGIYVFIAWMWLAIIILIFFLRQKIKEVDRLFWLKFFQDKKK